MKLFNNSKGSKLRHELFKSPEVISDAFWDEVKKEDAKQPKSVLGTFYGTAPTTQEAITISAIGWFGKLFGK